MAAHNQIQGKDKGLNKTPPPAENDSNEQIALAQQQQPTDVQIAALLTKLEQRAETKENPQPEESSEQSEAANETLDETVSSPIVPEIDLPELELIRANNPEALTASELNTTNVSNDENNYFNIAPSIINNTISITEGASIMLSQQNVSAYDPETAAQNLQFSVSAVKHGEFQLAADKTPVDSFSQEEINSGDIQFVHDGSNNAPEFILTVSDGAQTTTSTPLIFFTNFNDTPMIRSNDSGPLTFIENSNGIILNNSLTIYDSDNTEIQSATIKIIGNFQAGEDLLEFNDFSNINGSFDINTGTLTLTGTDSLENYQAALATVTYLNTSENPNPATRTISITVNDGEDSSNVVTNYVNIVPVNDAPIANNDSFSVNEDNILINNILKDSGHGADFDIDGDGLSVSLISGPNNGNLILNTNGDFEYTPDENYNGPDNFIYKINDGHGKTAQATTNINVNSINDAPTANNDDFANTSEDGSVMIDVLTNDFDNEGAITITNLNTAGIQGSATIIGNQIRYFTSYQFDHLNGGETATENFSYEIQDEAGETATANVTVTINGADDPTYFYPTYSSVDLSDDSNANFEIQHTTGNAISLAAAGDINSDGFSDILIAVPDTSSNNGEVHIILGNENNISDPLNLATNQIYFSGISADDQLGTTIKPLGDINGDNLDDFLLHAGGANTSYVIFGSQTPLNHFTGFPDLENLGNNSGFSIQDIDANITIDGIGDVNGDGLDDFAIGDGNTNQVHIVFGQENGYGVTLNLATTSSYTFSNVTSAESIGDINGDSYNDFVLNSATTNTGFIVYGSISPLHRSFGFMDTNQIEFNSTKGFKINYTDANSSISGVGDVNGDGFDDFIIGEPGAFASSGEAHLFYGNALGFGNYLNFNNSINFIGSTPGDELGTDVAFIGDINGDGFNDFMLTAPGANENYIFYGDITFSGVSVNTLETNNYKGFIVELDASFSYTNYSGDINGDDFDDLVFVEYDSSNNIEQTIIINGAPSEAVIMGDSNDNSLGGDSNNNILHGQAGDDILNGQAGNDVLIGGSGDDTLIYDNQDITLVNGGDGNDTLAIQGNNIHIDFISNSPYESIESIDINGNGSNSVTIGLNEVLSLPEETDSILPGLKQITIDGGTDDSVAVTDGTWNYEGQTFDGEYDIYTVDIATLLINTDIQNVNINII